MKTREFGKNVAYLTPDEYDLLDNPSFLRANMRVMMDRAFTRRPTYKSLIKAFSKKSGLSGFAMLYGHGGVRKGNWHIGDRGRPYVQNWINSIDGERAVIALRICNPEDMEITSKRSIILHTTRSLTALDIYRKGPVRIYVPDEEYLDGDYTRIRKTLERLSV